VSDNSKIEWLARSGTKPASWNVVTGCSKVSPGCKHCFAETFARRQMGPWKGRAFTDVQCHEDRLAIPLGWKKPRTVFVNSMSDLFHEAVPDAFIWRVFSMMQMARHHTFIILTKRPKRMRSLLTGSSTPGEVDDATLELLSRPDVERHVDGVPCLVNPNAPGGVSDWPLRNVILGVSIENKKTRDERVPYLLKTPAAVKVLSVEPLLEDIADDEVFSTYFYSGFDEPPYDDVINWVLVGGESGHQARPCDVAWIRRIVEQCKVADAPVFVKQLGGNPMHRIVYGPLNFDPNQETHLEPMRLTSRKGADPSEWPDDLRVREWPEVRT
jgi:protein gp37